MNVCCRKSDENFPRFKVNKFFKQVNFKQALQIALLIATEKCLFECCAVNKHVATLKAVESVFMLKSLQNLASLASTSLFILLTNHCIELRIS